MTNRLKAHQLLKYCSAATFVQKQNQCRPLGSEPLPRGIVQDKSNFEMVQMESLGGDPERKDDARPPKSLLAVPAGIKQKAVVDKLVAKVTSL